MLTKANLLVVVPALNEEQTIGSVIDDLCEHDFQVLVVNDGSTDQTSDLARTSGAQVLDLPYNMGVGGALRAGFQVAVENGYLAVVQVDADGQHPVASIERLISEANESQAHLVLGSRFRSNGTTMSVPPGRRLVMRLLAWTASRATGVEITDASSGFRLIQEPLLTQFSISFSANYLGDTYEALLSAGRGGYTVREVPAAMRARTIGESRASVFESIQFTLKGLVVAVLGLHPRIKKLN